MSDEYELAKSELPQDLDDSTPYENKQWNYIQDINSGVYTNNQQSLVQFDLSSIYNSGKFIDVSQMYLTIPIVYTAAWGQAAAAGAVVPVAGNEFLITPKNGSWNLIHSLEVTVDGKNVIQQTPNINVHTNFKMMSQMSKDDLKTMGATLGCYPDDVQAYLYNTVGSATGAIGGNGLSNNMIFPILAAGTVGAANGNEQAPGLAAVGIAAYDTQGYVYNSALQKRSQRIANNMSAPANGMSALIGTGNMGAEFQPYYTVLNTDYMTWYDIAVIRLCDVCDFFAKAPLTKNFNGLLRIYFNTGAMNIGVAVATGNMYMSGANSSFSNTCPFTINQMPILQIPALTANLQVSCTIAKSSVSTAMNGIALSASGGASPMNACRCYFPMVTLKPSVALKYISENRAKKIIYTNVLASIYTAIASGANYNQLVQSGVRNIKGVLIVPFIASSVHGSLTNLAGLTTFAPYSSPFDTAPNTTPCSLTNLQVSVGQVNQLMNYYNYTFEEFYQQLNLYEKINSSDLGLSNGQIGQAMFEHGYRYYYVDCSRGTNADSNTPRNVNISFTNNTLKAMDILVFVEYYCEAVLDCETGRVSV